MSPIASITRRLGGLLTAVALAGAAVILVPAVLGYQRYVITSGSMTGTYDRGSIVFDEVVPSADLRPGDVITYTPPPGPGRPRGLVTHRIVTIEGSGGARVLRTKGDANRAPDPWTFTLRTTQARVAFHVPYLGFAVAALGDRRLRILLVGLPALLIALSTLARLWQDAGVEARAAVEGGGR
jgi:signal peptidase I